MKHGHEFVVLHLVQLEDLVFQLGHLKLQAMAVVTVGRQGKWWWHSGGT